MTDIFEPMYILQMYARKILRYDMYIQCKETEEEEEQILSNAINRQSFSIKTTHKMSSHASEMYVGIASIRIDGIESIIFVKVDCIIISTRS